MSLSSILQERKVRNSWILLTYLDKQTKKKIVDDTISEDSDDDLSSDDDDETLQKLREKLLKAKKAKGKL